ncbi:unnamed protein product [Pleuronectes platessa]|uniref:Uncharacterized protein n=1 Tax=Pleuronectes platessa TaxID=8262 RepID=A0A9N7YM68_PLEPL|nr:unnamed protein product [Pleuronectes platessa]
MPFPFTAIVSDGSQFVMAANYRGFSSGRGSFKRFDCQPLLVEGDWQAAGSSGRYLRDFPRERQRSESSPESGMTHSMATHVPAMDEWVCKREGEQRASDGVGEGNIGRYERQESAEEFA